MPIALLPFACSFALQAGPTPATQDDIPLGRPPDRDSRPDTGSLTGSHGSHRRPTPPDGNDVQVSSVNDQDQDETVIRIDRTDRLHLIGGANDNRTGPYNCAFYATLDGGLTWSELFFPDPDNFGNAGDPAAAFGPAGEPYFCALAFGSNSSIYVGRSFDGGITVPSWSVAVPRSNSSFEDKQFMIADDGDGALAGAVYVTWTKFKNAGGVPIYMTASFDQGQTWTSGKRLSDSDICQGSCPAVGPSGELYVAFYDFNTDTIQIDVSIDGGATWGTDVKVADIDYLSSAPHTSFRTNSFPTLDVNTSGGPYHGNLYVAWADDQGNHSDVLMSKSTDGGATWSAPVAVHDVLTNSQFSPWLDVNANGNVNFGFFDRRDHAGDIRQKIFVSRSSDGGATFQPNVAVADVSYNANKYNQGFFIGDYTGLAASDRTVHPIWTDGRNDTNDVYTSRVQLDLHTDVNAISAATGGVATFTVNPGPLYQGADYRILGSVTGTSPGLTFPSGVNLPVNFDAFLLATITYANTAALPGFAGVLDATGSATAAMDTGGPLPPTLAGLQMDFAVMVTVGSTVRWASNPTHLEIVP